MFKLGEMETREQAEANSFKLVEGGLAGISRSARKGDESALCDTSTMADYLGAIVTIEVESATFTSFLCLLPPKSMLIFGNIVSEQRRREAQAVGF